MKKLIVLTAFVSVIAISGQASACEWMKQAAKPATVVTCEGGTCTAEQPAQEAAATEAAPAASPQTAEEPAPAPSSATVVASGQ